MKKEKKLLADVANLATCCHDDYDVLLEVWEPCANAMLVVALVSQRFRQRARALAENDSLHSDHRARARGAGKGTLGELGRDTGDTTGHTWSDAMLVVLLPKLWFWIGNHDWHNCFWMSL